MVPPFPVLFTAVRPSNTVAPAITGTPVVGNLLSVSTGTWGGTPPITYAYQWKRGVTNIGTGVSTYTLVAADVGQNITCVVTATNAGGSASATSNTVVGVQTTFDPAPSMLGTGVSLSESNLRMTGSSASDHNARSTTTKSSGKWYFEYQKVSGLLTLGVGPSSIPVDTWVGAGPNCTGLEPNTGNVFLGSSNQGSAGVGTFANNDVVGVAINFTLGKIWFSKNGTWGSGQDPATGTGGFNMGVVTQYAIAAANGAASARIRTLAAQFLTAPPSGFSAWDT